MNNVVYDPDWNSTLPFSNRNGHKLPNLKEVMDHVWACLSPVTNSSLIVVDYVHNLAREYKQEVYHGSTLPTLPD
jgi:hypothetical protein